MSESQAKINFQYTNEIWMTRMQLASAEKRLSQTRHFLTGDEHYLNEFCYWTDVKRAAEKHIKI